MAEYPELASLMRAVDPEEPEEGFTRTIRPYLTDVWLDDFWSRSRDPEVVETSVADFSYLFDLSSQCLIAAWGISQGRHSGDRDKNRMRGHPLGAGTLYHRGHAIPHRLGGPLDINLLPQLGSINIGPFRPLENRAVATPGSLYFTYWEYPASRLSIPTQRPVGVDQGLLVAGQAPSISRHGN